jgi:tetratricopeptide (TPR) repeat protein
MMMENFKPEIQQQLDANTEALFWEPDHEMHWLKRAQILASAQRIDLAVKACSQGLARQNHCGHLFLARGHYYINLGRPQEAAADLARARVLLGENWQVMYHLALAHYLSGEYQYAEGLYRHMITLFPTETEHVSLYNWLWACLVHQGRLEEAAVVSASVGSSWEPGDDIAYHRVQLFVSGRISLEEALGGKEVQKEINSITTAYGIYNYYQYVKQDAETAETLLKAILQHCEGEYQYCFANQAAKSELAGCGVQAAEAETLVKQLKADQENEFLWHALSQCYAKKSDFEQEIKVLSLGIAHSPRPGRLLQERGHRYINLGQHEMAAADLTWAAEAYPEDASLLYHYALALYLIKEYGKAEKIYRRCRKAADRWGDFVCSTNWLWACLQHQNKPEEAMQALEPIRKERMALDHEGNRGYFNLVQLYKGLMTVEEVMAQMDLEALTAVDATTAYGISNYYRYVEKDAEKAEAMLDQILASGSTEWHAAFAYQAAEAEKSSR